MNMPSNAEDINEVIEGRGWSSPLRSLYFQWRRVKEAYSSVPDGSDQIEGRLVHQMREIEQYAANYVPQTMEDLAFKIIFADDEGDMSMNLNQVALARSAYEMARIEPYTMGVAA